VLGLIHFKGPSENRRVYVGGISRGFNIYVSSMRPNGLSRQAVVLDEPRDF